MSPSPGRGTAGPDVLKVCGRAQRSRAGCRARQTRRKAGGRTPVFTSHSGNAIFKPHYSRVHSLQMVRSRLGVGSGLTGDEERCRILPRVPLPSSFLCLTPNSVSEVAGKRRGDPAWSSPSCFCAPEWLHNPNQTRRTGRSFCAPPKRMKTMGNRILKAQRVKLILLCVLVRVRLGTHISVRIRSSPERRNWARPGSAGSVFLFFMSEPKPRLTQFYAEALSHAVVVTVVTACCYCGVQALSGKSQTPSSEQETG